MFFSITSFTYWCILTQTPSVYTDSTVNDKMPHILTTSANLLGVCFFIITGIHLTSAKENIEVMRLVTATSFLLLLSCFLSYISMRTTRQSRTLERIADYLFLFAIVLLFMTIGFLSFGIGLV